MASRSKTVQSVDRAIGLLRTLAEAGEAVSVAQLAARCGLERATAWRLLWTLESNGLVEREAGSRAYRICLGWLGLPQGHTIDALARVARPVLRQLADDHNVTASLVHVQRFRLEYIDQVDGAAFTSPRWEGQALSLHASSPGKAVLAALPEAEWRGLVGATLERLTDSTITSMDEFERELEIARDEGYAVSRGEDVTYSNGASAVIRIGGRPVAAINLWGPDRIVSASRLQTLGRAAASAARSVEELLN